MAENEGDRRGDAPWERNAPGGEGPEVRDLPSSPFPLLDDWMVEARADERIRYPNAACLATVDAEGRPDARIVLLKDLGADGFVFYTNYNSPKARDLFRTPEAALVVYWEPLGRQVRVRGAVERVSAEETAAYFATRPRGSRVGAWASEQSAPVADRGSLEERYRAAEERFGRGDVPCPSHWGGFRLHAREVEFWLEREFRLHDRFLYRREPEGEWTVQRLFP